MKTFNIRKFYKSYRKLISFILPEFLKLRMDGERYSIVNFIKNSAKLLEKNELVLDAGAGTRPYKKYFSHTRYESTDFENIFDQESKTRHNFICNLDNIPKPDNHYDTIINTQVLEHVPEPEKVLREFNRILKPNGKLFLTAPQGWGIHDAPFHFFNFTKYGLEYLFKKAGFKIVFVKPRGGIFWYLGKRIKTLLPYLFFQYVFTKDDNNQIKFKLHPLIFILIPFFVVFYPITNIVVPLTFFYLDRLDKKQDYTLGYACYCVKSKP